MVNKSTNIEEGEQCRKKLKMLKNAENVFKNMLVNIEKVNKVKTIMNKLENLGKCRKSQTCSKSRTMSESEENYEKYRKSQKCHKK